MKKVHTETSSFGELALIDDKPRRARIIASTDLHLATVSKMDFNSCIAKFN
jgi:hypothetical protein